MRLAGLHVSVLAPLLLAGAAGAPPGGQTSAASPGTSAKNSGNSDWAQAQHYVVLVSLEGFGWDDASGDGARNLLALGKHGASAAQGMLPSYPAFDWPNQLTIVTGLFPEHHGIVADSFLDPARQARFEANDPKTAADGAWYSGTPLWSLAARREMRTGCIGWAGCTAQIAGSRPTCLGRGSEQPEAETRQILAWLHLPAAERPHLIAAQFDEPGESARRFGPDAPQTRAAVRRMDAEIGKLKAGLDATHLPIDFVVVSDHGMAKPDGGWITLNQFADLSGFDIAGTLLYGKTEEDRERVYDQLKKATSEFFVYRLKNVPAGLHFRNERAGDPVIVATGAYAIRADEAAGTGGASLRAVDGFDARTVPAMKAIFCAAGPDIVEGKTVAPFANVNLYPWLAHLLGLNPPKTDGSLNILSGTLRDNGETGK